MTPSPVWCIPHDPLEHAARLMAKHDCGALPVIDDPVSRRPVGVITDRDIVIRVLAAGRSSLDCVVQDVMSPEPIAVHLGASFHDCARAMMVHRVRRIIVVDDRGRLIGIVTDGDLARSCRRWPQLEHDLAELVKEVSAPGHLPGRSLIGAAVVGEAIRSARPLGDS